MTDQAQPRRLAVIVAVDMAGFSARMEKDEATSTAEVVDLRNKVAEIARAHAGRVFNTAGDGVAVVARLQSFAPVGGVAVSRIVRDQVAGKVPCTFEDLGEHPASSSGRRSMQVFVARPDEPPAPKVH